MTYKVNYEVKKELFNDNRIFKDSIFQTDNTEDLTFDEKKLNKYSKALRLENGKEYQDIFSWINDITGKKIIVCIKDDAQKENRKYISYFKPEDAEIANGEKLMVIESVEMKTYANETKYRLEVVLKEVLSDVELEELLPF